MLKNTAGFFTLEGRMESTLEKETLKQEELNPKYAKWNRKKSASETMSPEGPICAMEGMWTEGEES